MSDAFDSQQQPQFATGSAARPGDRSLPSFTPPPLAEQPLAAPPAAGGRPPASAAPSPCPGEKITRPARRSNAASAVELPPLVELPSLDDDADSPRVPMVGRLALESTLVELTQAMQQCRQLYLSCVPQQGGFLDDVARQLTTSQDRLHKCLLLKICATMAEADGRWAYEEQRCAAAVLQHVGVPYSQEQLQETADYVARQAAKLDWTSLVQPFHEFLELRDRLGELETVVARMANLIAKVDGSVSPRETAALRQIQQSVRGNRPRAVAAKPRPLPAAKLSRLANVARLWKQDGEEPAAPHGRGDSAALLQQSLQRLDELIGLQPVKTAIRDFIDLTLLQNERRQAGLPYELPNLHLVFAGPPGVGKITVAKILADLLFVIGVLKHGRLVELNPLVDLASHQAGEAEQMTGLKIAQAIGGTLLVDHASVMFSTGAAAPLRLLLQTMAQYRGQMAVILADQADRLRPLFEQHPELLSPFSCQLHFSDYSAGQLGQILQRFCNRSQYRVTRLAQIKLLLGFQWRLQQDGARCGNGHLVRQVFDEAVHRLAHRIAGVSPLTTELLTTFEDRDIVMQGVPAQVWRNLSNPQRRFLIGCPGCGSEHLVGPEFLGTHVACRRCQHRFVSAWGEPQSG